MVDIKEKVKNTLSDIAGVRAFYFYPDSFNSLPCVSYYEANNAPHSFADDTEYSSEIIYMTDIWGKTSEQVTNAALQVERRMRGLGFVREFTQDVRDNESKARHKAMRFKLITGVDYNG